MKIKFLFTLLLSVACLCTSAQVRVENRYDDQPTVKAKTATGYAMKYGVKAGVNLTTMASDMSFDPNFKMGTSFRAGVFANFHWGQRTVTSRLGTGLFGIQPELLYSNEVSKSDAGDVKLSLIELPIMFKVYPLPALSIEAGPEFAYLLSVSPDKVAFPAATIDLSSCKGLMMGAGAGLSYELEMGLVLGARYSIGFTDLAKNLKWKNSSNIQVTVGWMF